MKKIRVMRQCKGWTQEDMAEKLNLSVSSYAKIEQGKSDIRLEKLRKIAETLDVNMDDLVSPKESTVLNFVENCNFNHHSQQGTILLTETQCAHELEKALLMLQQKDKEIAHLEEIVALLKKNHFGTEGNNGKL